jgi:hypothetical protein
MQNGKTNEKEDYSFPYFLEGFSLNETLELIALAVKEK